MRLFKAAIQCALLIWLTWLLVGCSTPRQFTGVAIGEPIILVSAVPPLLQTRKISCGPTCLATVAAYWGKDFGALENQTLSEDFNADELSEMGHSLGLRVFEYKGSMTDLETNLSKGRPVIVLIPQVKYEDSAMNLTIQGMPLSAILMMFEPTRSHWVVVVGMTEFKVIVQDPALGRIALPRGKFEQWWASKRNTCLLAVPAS